MVWLAEKKIFHYILDMGFERIEIPVRVKFEYEVKDGILLPDTLTKKMLYNQSAILDRYPNLRMPSLDNAIEEMVDSQLSDIFRQYGFLHDNED